jgi:hypothetical protein
MLSGMAQYDQWPSKEEASQQIGISVRTLERLVRRREIKQAYRRVPNRRPLAVLNPVDLAKVAAQMAGSPEEAADIVAPPRLAIVAPDPAPPEPAMPAPVPRHARASAAPFPARPALCPAGPAAPSVLASVAHRAAGSGVLRAARGAYPPHGAQWRVTGRDSHGARVED